MASRLLAFGKRSLKTSVAPFSPLLNAGRRLRGRHQGAGQVLILGYHRIVADLAQAERESISGLITSVETFRRHLQLVREGYEVLTLDEAAVVLRGERQVGRAAAVITFDDGYRDVYDQAWPVLRELDLPATVFLPTAYIDGPRLLEHDRIYWLIFQARARGLSLQAPLAQAGFSSERVAALCSEPDAERLADQLIYLPSVMRERALRKLETALGHRLGPYPSGYELLRWEMIKEMAGAGITFAAHTDRHLALTFEAESAVERELVNCKRALEARLNRPVRHFAYPNGLYNDAIKAQLAHAGFEAAVTTDRRLNHCGDDLLSLGRTCLSEESTRGVTGKYSHAVARLRLAA